MLGPPIDYVKGDMEAPGGVEPPTNSLGNCCSIQLSYGAGVRSTVQFTTVAWKTDVRQNEGRMMRPSF